MASLSRITVLIVVFVLLSAVIILLLRKRGSTPVINEGPCGLRRHVSSNYCYLNSAIQVLFNNSTIIQILNKDDIQDVYIKKLKELRTETLRNNIVDPDPYYKYLLERDSPLNKRQDLNTYEYGRQNDPFEGLSLLIDHIKSEYPTEMKDFEVVLQIDEYCPDCKRAHSQDDPHEQDTIMLYGNEGAPDDYLIVDPQYAKSEDRNFCTAHEKIMKYNILKSNKYINIQLQNAVVYGGQSDENRRIILIPHINIGVKQYMLISFIVYAGNIRSGKAGHYMSYVMRNNKWYSIDDSEVKLIHTIETILCGDAIILFGQYQLQ